MVKPTVISIFAGGGGSSLGYKWAGFKELLAIDFDKNSCDVLKANFDFPVWQRDIKGIIPEEILSFCKIKKGELSILDGSPPCQGFSTTGKRKINDPRNELFKEYIRLIDTLQPKVFIMENVSGMIEGKMKGLFIEIMQTLKSLNYHIKCKLLNAKYYEVPQSRERLFFIGTRKDLNIEPSFPIPLNKIISVREALENVPKDDNIKLPRGKMWEYGIKTKPGECVSKYHPLGHYFNSKRNRINSESFTIEKTFRESQCGVIHPFENRFHTISEIKRLCSFPDSYILFGKFEERWARLGNSVMPKQMYHIAKHIKNNILEKVD